MRLGVAGACRKGRKGPERDLAHQLYMKSRRGLPETNKGEKERGNNHTKGQRASDMGNQRPRGGGVVQMPKKAKAEAVVVYRQPYLGTNFASYVSSGRSRRIAQALPRAAEALNRALTLFLNSAFFCFSLFVTTSALTFVWQLNVSLS